MPRLGAAEGSPCDAPGRKVFFRGTRPRKNDFIFLRRLRAAQLCEAFSASCGEAGAKRRPPLFFNFDHRWTVKVSFSPSLPTVTVCPSETWPRMSMAASSVSTCFCRYRFTGRAP